MDDLKLINDIISDGVRDSSYVAVIISSCLFIAYTAIIKCVDYFKAKAKDKPLLEMSKAMKEMADNINKLNNVLDKTLKESERKEIRQCDRAIQLGFKAFAFKIAQECNSVIVHNNIDKNKDYIEDNILKVVNTEYYRLYSVLSDYEINEVNVATKLREEWIKEISNAVIAIIYDGQEPIYRITHISDKLNILINEYSTNVSNKIFNT